LKKVQEKIFRQKWKHEIRLVKRILLKVTLQLKEIPSKLWLSQTEAGTNPDEILAGCAQYSKKHYLNEKGVE